MRRARCLPAPALALALGAPAACGGGGGTPADAGQDDGSGPAVCASPAALFAVALDGSRQVLGDGSSLGIILGFQGFQFANIGITTAETLPSPTVVEILVAVPGKLDRSLKIPNVTTTRGAGGWETNAIIVYFNDVPLAELIGHEGTIELRATGTTCVAAAAARVKLASGGFQGADGGAGDGSDDGADDGGDGPSSEGG